MKKFFIFKKMIIFAIVLVFIKFNAHSIENKILFKIENQIITTIDLDNHIKYLSAINTEIQKLDYEKLLEIAKNNLIREKIKKTELVKEYQKIEIEEVRLNEIISSIFSQQEISDIKELEKYLSSLDLKFSEIKEKISIEILWNQLIYQKFSSKIKINKDDLKKEILANSNKVKKKYLLSEVLFDVDNKSKLEEKISIIENSIKRNGFKNTALTYSISNTSTTGGNLGWIDENILNEVIKKEIDKIKVGEYTKPILTQNGFLIIMIDDIKEEKIEINIEEELSKLINIEANQQLNQFSTSYYNKIQKNTLINEI